MIFLPKTILVTATLIPERPVKTEKMTGSQNLQKSDWLSNEKVHVLFGSSDERGGCDGATFSKGERMKTKSFRFGRYTFKNYCKPVGQGYEVGTTWGKQTVFVGNFIHHKEANQWFGILNKEVVRFTRKYWNHSVAPSSFFCKFFSNHLYRTYYGFLDKIFVKHTRVYTKAVSRDAKKYHSMKRRSTGQIRHGHKTAA